MLIVSEPHLMFFTVKFGQGTLSDTDILRNICHCCGEVHSFQQPLVCPVKHTVSENKPKEQMFGHINQTK